MIVLLFICIFHYFFRFRQQILQILVFDIRWGVISWRHIDLWWVFENLNLIGEFVHWLFLLINLWIFPIISTWFHFLALLLWFLPMCLLKASKVVLAGYVAVNGIRICLNGGLLLKKLLNIVFWRYLHTVWLVVPRILYWVKNLICLMSWHLFSWCLYSLLILIYHLILNQVLALIVKLILAAIVVFKFLMHSIWGSLPLRCLWSFLRIGSALVDLLAISISIRQLIISLPSRIWISEGDVHTVDFQFIAHLFSMFLNLNFILLLWFKFS